MINQENGYNGLFIEPEKRCPISVENAAGGSAIRM
jgi:hypothetical protein